ncbi:MAG: hypothetical protein ABI587_18180 [Gemmatimonadales bacterium]
MLLTLAFRHLLVHKGRSLFLLLGYGLGVGVMIVLLSVGEAMLTQSADVALVGGGEVTVLPQGIDIEAMRTGGVSGMFFGIERARFLARQLLGGPRHAAQVRAVSPVIENKLVYLSLRGRSIAVRAGGEIPSRVLAVGAARTIVSGAWIDTPADSAWITPTLEQLYHELDRFHIPAISDSSWGEWHYFNLAAGPDEWWYITYLVGGEVLRGKWGGQVLISHRTPDGHYQRFSAVLPSSAIVLDTTRADLTLGPSQVIQRHGDYALTAEARGTGGPLRLSLTVHPERNRFFPPVSLHEGAYPSGYVVPMLSGTATGTICVAGHCRTLANVPAYHDHNWGVWRGVSWDWGTVRGKHFNLLYGAVYAPADTLAYAGSGSPRLLVALVDSLGVRQILRATAVTYEGELSRRQGGGPNVPARFHFVASRDADTVRIETEIVDAQATDRTASREKSFLQMRGSFHLEGVIAGVRVADDGTGFFETYVVGKP